MAVLRVIGQRRRKYGQSGQDQHGANPRAQKVRRDLSQHREEQIDQRNSDQRNAEGQMDAGIKQRHRSGSNQRLRSSSVFHPVN